MSVTVVELVGMLIFGLLFQFCPCMTLPGLTGGTLNTIMTGSVFRIFRTSSFQQCYRLCLYSSDCASVNWRSTTRECQMNSQDNDTGGLVDSKFNIFVPVGRMVRQMSPCDERPCNTKHMCVPVIKSTSHICVNLGDYTYLPSTSERPTLESGTTTEEQQTTTMDEVTATPDQSTATQQPTATTEEKTATPDQTTATQGQPATITEEQTATPNQTTATPEQPTPTTEEQTATPNQTTTTTEEQTATPDQATATQEQPTITEEHTATPNHTTIIPEPTTTTPEEQTTTPDLTTAAQEQPTTITEEQTTTPDLTTAAQEQPTTNTEEQTTTPDLTTAATGTATPSLSATCDKDSDCNSFPDTTCSDGLCTCNIGYDLDLVRDVCRSIQECSSLGSDFTKYRSKFIYQHNTEEIKPSTLSECSQVCLAASYTCKTFDMISGGCYTQEVTWFEVAYYKRKSSTSYGDSDHYQRRCNW